MTGNELRERIKAILQDAIPYVPDGVYDEIMYEVYAYTDAAVLDALRRDGR